MKHNWAAYLIPDIGEARYRNGQAHGIAAQSTGRTEARLMFAADPNILSIELVVLEGQEMNAGLSEVIERKK